MTVLDILSAPWAIQPAKLQEISAIYSAHVRGEGIDLAAVEKRLGRPLDNQANPYAVQDGVAIIAVDGVMAKRMNMFSAISGGTSTQLVARDIAAAEADPAVHSIVFAIDSPGGTVDGTQALADVAAACKKPTATLASGAMCSAAYWFGCQADAVYVADSTTNVGSIGVVATHTDVSKAQETAGVKTTEVFAGTYKRINSQYEPLSQAGRQYMQDQVDYTYALFVDAVAQARGVSVDVVLKNMADGRIFMGQQAVDAGLVDGITTLDALVSKLVDQHQAQINSAFTGASASGTALAAAISHPATPGASAMTPEQLLKDHPEVAMHFQNQGASAERERIAGIEANALPGHEKLMAAMKADASKTPADFAMAIIAAEKQQRHAAANAAASEAPAPVAAAAPAAVDKPAAQLGAGGYIGAGVDATALDGAARAHMSQNPGVSYVDAIKAVQQGA